LNPWNFLQPNVLAGRHLKPNSVNLPVLEEEVGFEPTEPFYSPSVFKTDTINQTLPLFQVVAPVGGIEPPAKILEIFMLPLHHTDVYIYQ
jgi:hypothetical protein